MKSVESLVFFLKRKLRRHIFPSNELKTLVSANLPKAPLRILDVGCGNGWFMRGILEEAPAGSSGCGIETEERYFTAETLKNGCQLKILSPEQALVETSYNLMIFNDVLHHIENKEKFLSCNLDKLEIGGRVLIKDMNPENKICRYWNRVHDKLINGDSIMEISPEKVEALFLGNEDNVLNSNFRLIGEGRRRIFLYDHYWFCYKKVN